MSRIAHSWKSGVAVMAAASIAALAGGHAAAAASPAKARAGALQAVVDCRKLTDGAARLDCFDKAAAQLDAAEQAGDVVVVDRAQVQEAQRSAFGFNFRMPSFMTGGDGGGKSADLETLESTIDSARQVDGKWIFRLADGAVWNQTDNEHVRNVRAGAKVTIRKGAIGSYFLSVDGQKSVRAKRQN